MAAQMGDREIRTTPVDFSSTIGERHLHVKGDGSVPSAVLRLTVPVRPVLGSDGVGFLSLVSRSVGSVRFTSVLDPSSLCPWACFRVSFSGCSLGFASFVVCPLHRPPQGTQCLRPKSIPPRGPLISGDLKKEFKIKQTII